MKLPWNRIDLYDEEYLFERLNAVEERVQVPMPPEMRAEIHQWFRYRETQAAATRRHLRASWLCAAWGMAVLIAISAISGFGLAIGVAANAVVLGYNAAMIGRLTERQDFLAETFPLPFLDPDFPIETLRCYGDE